MMRSHRARRHLDRRLLAVRRTLALMAHRWELPKVARWVAKHGEWDLDAKDLMLDFLASLPTPKQQWVEVAMNGKGLRMIRPSRENIHHTERRGYITPKDVGALHKTADWNSRIQ